MNYEKGNSLPWTALLYTYAMYSNIAIFFLQAHAMGTGGGPAYTPKYTELEEQVLAIIGAFLVAAKCSYDDDAAYVAVLVIIIIHIPNIYIVQFTFVSYTDTEIYILSKCRLVYFYYVLILIP